MQLPGEVVLPDTPEYEAVGRPAIVRFQDIRPHAVLRCADESEVADAIGYARAAGLPLALRSGGHCFGGRSSGTGLVLDVSPMHGVASDGELAVIGAGTRLGEVYDELARHGRTIAAGCGPEVGIAGLTLGGGLGILGRRYGLTCDQLVAARVVLADGRVVECDEQRHADLFWALRGAGGGQFGVLTSFTFRTLPAPRATALHLRWPAADAVALLLAWQELAPAGPDELAASLLLTSEGIGAPVVHVFGACQGAESDARAMLEPLLARVGDPASAQLHELPYREVKRRLAEHGPAEARALPEHAFSRSEFFRAPLPADAVHALVGEFVRDAAPGESRELDFSPWAGAYNRVPVAATAFPHRAERFLLKQTVTIDADAADGQRAAARGWLARSWALTHPHGSGGVYVNFPDPELAGHARAYHGPNLDRLRQVKARYDPDYLFRFHQSL